MRPCVSSLRTSQSPFSERPAERHSDRPGKLHVLDVFADDLSIRGIEAFQPFTNRFSTGRKCVEPGGKPLHVVILTQVYLNWYMGASPVTLGSAPPNDHATCRRSRCSGVARQWVIPSDRWYAAGS